MSMEQDEINRIRRLAGINEQEILGPEQDDPVSRQEEAEYDRIVELEQRYQAQIFKAIQGIGLSEAQVSVDFYVKHSEMSIDIDLGDFEITMDQLSKISQTGWVDLTSTISTFNNRHGEAGLRLTTTRPIPPNVLQAIKAPVA